jgi:osmotically inducible lipoprotein OsmB
MFGTASKAACAATIGLSLLAAGCSQTQRYTATGAALGAGGGAIIAGATGGSAAAGAVIGGVAGGATGWCIAKRCLR